MCVVAEQGEHLALQVCEYFDSGGMPLLPGLKEVFPRRHGEGTWSVNVVYTHEDEAPEWMFGCSRYVSVSGKPVPSVVMGETGAAVIASDMEIEIDSSGFGPGSAAEVVFDPLVDGFVSWWSYGHPREPWWSLRSPHARFAKRDQGFLLQAGCALTEQIEGAASAMRSDIAERSQTNHWSGWTPFDLEDVIVTVDENDRYVATTTWSTGRRAINRVEIQSDALVVPERTPDPLHVASGLLAGTYPEMVNELDAKLQNPDF